MSSASLPTTPAHRAAPASPPNAALGGGTGVARAASLSSLERFDAHSVRRAAVRGAALAGQLAQQQRRVASASHQAHRQATELGVALEMRGRLVRGTPDKHPTRASHPLPSTPRPDPSRPVASAQRVRRARVRAPWRGSAPLPL